jgi:glycosyltransferase involved in cell wall biosynthesis
MGNGCILPESREQDGGYQPDASIVITCYNRGELVRKTFGAILAQQTSRSFEILVIDSGSVPQTIEILNEFPVHLIRIPHEEFNHGLTRDMGAGMAGGAILIFLNQDAEPRHNLPGPGIIPVRTDEARFFD